MKNLAFIGGLLLLILVSSCTKEEQNNSLEQNDLVRMGIEAPVSTMMPITRSGENEVLRFVLEVWNKEMTTRQHRLVQPGSGDGKSNFTFEVTPGDYQLLLWADYVDPIGATPADADAPALVDKYYTTSSADGLRAVSLDGDKFSLNNSKRDAFFYTLSFTKGAETLNLESLKLKRALAKLIIREKDADVYTSFAAAGTKFSASYQVPSLFNVATGKTDNTNQFTVNQTELTPVGTVDEKEQVLFYDYILTSSTSVLGEINVVTSGKTTDVPTGLLLRQNARTILSGTFLTAVQAGDDVKLDTEIDDKWDATEVEEGGWDGKKFEGDGTEDSPYEIGTIEQLIKLQNLVNTGGNQYATACYKQTTDITFPNSGTRYICIGTEANPFKGKYDGSNHKIQNFYAAGGVVTDNFALFGVVSGATLTNIRIDNMNNTSAPKKGISAVICGKVMGAGSTTVISNSGCTNSTFGPKASMAGVICGQVESGTLKVKACKIEKGTGAADVKTISMAGARIGGFVGHVVSGATLQIEDCAHVGLGVTNAINTVEKNFTDNYYIGGFCGQNEGVLSISRSYITGAVKKTVAAGVETTVTFNLHVIANGSNVTIDNCFYATAPAAGVETGIAKKFGADSWPTWDTTTTSWKSNGSFNEGTNPTYPALQWES